MATRSEASSAAFCAPHVTASLVSRETWHAASQAHDGADFRTNDLTTNNRSEFELSDRLLSRDARRVPTQVQPVQLQDIQRYALEKSSVLRDLGGSIVSSPNAIATAWDASIVDSDPIFGTLGTISEYDPRWNAQVLDSNNDRVFNNLTIGGGATELTQDLVSNRAAIARRTWDGSVWEFGQNTVYDNNNRLGNLFINSWEKQLEASLRKPLLRGAGREFNAIAGPNARPGLNFSNGFWIAQLNTQISHAEFAARLESYLISVEDAYWELYLAYRQFEYAQQNYLVAEQVYRVVRAKFEANLEGGEADREAEARSSMLRFQQLVQQSLGGGNSIRGIYSSELALRQLIGMPAMEGELLHTTSVPPVAPIVHDEEHALTCGKHNRPELDRQRMAIRLEELKLLAAKNFTLPQMDLITRYRVRGFGDDLWGSGGRFASAWQDIGTMEHQEWDFGLEMDAPIGQRQAKAGVQQSRLRLARAHAVLHEQERAIDFAIIDAISRAKSNYENVQLAEAILHASHQRLAATQAQFAMDRIPLDRVREAQEALQQASVQSEVAKIEYARALLDVQRQSGTYLTDIRVAVQTEPVR